MIPSKQQPQPTKTSTGLDYTGTKWTDIKTPAYSVEVIAQEDTSATPKKEKDIILTVKANVGFPRIYSLTVEGLLDNFAMVQNRDIANANTTKANPDTHGAGPG